MCAVGRRPCEFYRPDAPPKIVVSGLTWREEAEWQFDARVTDAWQETGNLPGGGEGPFNFTIVTPARLPELKDVLQFDDVAFQPQYFRHF